ncbi:MULTISPECIES: hypothetical protein [unclassified Wolbachia]|uniref:hypothetical protein n=1 Tax=unclassified Wolbachia TaxID=2640676 RepID=UPI00221F44D1|nr:hypothetical protein [Wolbachia endosymbiont (group B) of Sphaerophoria taeniata]
MVEDPFCHINQTCHEYCEMKFIEEKSQCNDLCDFIFPISETCSPSEVVDQLVSI